MMIEQWKYIDGFNGFYQISSNGKVKSATGLIRRASYTHDGYLKIRLVASGNERTARIHRLVAEAFIPNPLNKETVNHKDGNKTNNNVLNLEWADRHEQLIHAYKHHLKKPMGGTTNANAKLGNEQVLAIRKKYIRNSKEHGTVALGRKYGVSNCVIGLVIAGKSYKNVK